MHCWSYAYYMLFRDTPLQICLLRFCNTYSSSTSNKKKGLGLAVFQGIHTYIEGLINKLKQEIKAKVWVDAYTWEEVNDCY